MAMLYDKDKIVRLRKKLGISMNELARRAGIRGPSMHAIEKGRTKKIKADTLLGIAGALGVRVQDIMKAPPKGQNGDTTAEAMTVFGQLSPENQQAMLAAMLSLAAQQKNKT